MSKFESSIKHIPYPQTAVYAMLSDLSNLEKVRDKLPEDKIKDLSFDRDSLSISAPMGSVAMKIVEREEPNASSLPPQTLRLPPTCGYRWCRRATRHARCVSP